MKGKVLKRLGFPDGECRDLAKKAVSELMGQGISETEIMESLKKLSENPLSFAENPVLGKASSALLEMKQARSLFEEREIPAPCVRWGNDIEASAISQMNAACRLSVAVRGALMPDAHEGYGLPIGGVLAARNAVIPFAVGMDIACRMKLSVLDIPLKIFSEDMDRFRKAINTETRFGTGASFARGERRNHEVMDADWSFSGFVSSLKDKAWSQLGTSGSGNHFVEFGAIEIHTQDTGIQPGKYLALLSHSGSRGIGADTARRFSRIAGKLHPELPDSLSDLAWLDLDTQEGHEYWQTMTLMGDFSSANHRLVHRHIADHLGAEIIADVENHHNFAWKEIHFGEELIVHRKGATPAAYGVLGVIPGSMTAPAYVVKGKGNPESLDSASHGAGRKMSRSAAIRMFSRKDMDAILSERGVKLISGGIDEVPMAYKDIDMVMKEQADLVETVARFDPLLVKMAD